MQHIILYGFNSVGKTFFGKKLIEKNVLSFIDTDQVIEQLFLKKYKYLLSCREIYQKKGVLFFRNLETKACLTLKQSTASIVALGGGTLLKNFKFLTTQGKGVYLKCSFNFIYQRLLKIGLPYIFKDLNKNSLRKIFIQRCMIYESFPNKQTIYIDEYKNNQQILEKLEKILWETIPLE